MTSMISSLQAWVVDTVYWSIFSAYSLSGALMGVAHGSVHGVQALAPRLTSVQGIKKLALGERAVDGPINRAPAGAPRALLPCTHRACPGRRRGALASGGLALWEACVHLKA
jgi:hypothetical protein